MMTRKNNFSSKDIAVFALIVAILEAVKWALNFLPNIELVSFFIIIFTCFYGWKTLAPVFAFVAVETFFWGFGMWTISYLYVWPLLVLVTMLFRKMDSACFYAVVSGIFGLAFGALCALTTVFFQGIPGAFAWWIAGIPFDIIHFIGNFSLMLFLYRPVSKIMKKIISYNSNI